MANLRRNSLSIISNNSNNNQISETTPPTTRTRIASLISKLIQFMKKPHAFPFLLSIFIILTWLSLRVHQHSHRQSSSPPSSFSLSRDDDRKANLVRFSSSQISKDKRGWIIDPISLALDSNLLAGAISCASVHLGQIKPGSFRGNHRHYTCNETFIIWGATTVFRLENNNVTQDGGYAQVVIGADEVAIAASPSGTAHAVVNIDPVRVSYFMGCQDAVISYNSSTSDFNVWDDLLNTW